MTPERDRRNGKWLALVCAPGRKAGLAAHGRTVARARHVMDRLRDDLHFRRVVIQRSAPTDTARQRADLEARKRKLGMALADDAISETEYRTRMDAVKRDLAALDDATPVESEWTGTSREPLVDWDADDAALGERLRTLVRSVKLGEDMTPAAVEFRPSWLVRAPETLRRRGEKAASRVRRDARAHRGVGPIPWSDDTSRLDGRRGLLERRCQRHRSLLGQRLT
jgi:hypothetical protein